MVRSYVDFLPTIFCQSDRFIVLQSSSVTPDRSHLATPARTNWILVLTSSDTRYLRPPAVLLVSTRPTASTLAPPIQRRDRKSHRGVPRPVAPRSKEQGAIFDDKGDVYGRYGR